MRPAVLALPSLIAAASVPAVAHAAVDAVPPSAVSIETLEATEWKAADPAVVRVLQLAHGLVQQGVKYRRLKSARRLSPASLARPRRRLSCSEFVWSLFTLAGLPVGEHPVSSKRLAFGDAPYAQALTKVTDGSIMPGDVLAYADSEPVNESRYRGAPRLGQGASERVGGHVGAPRSVNELARQKRTLGASQVGHVVVVVSVNQRIVVGSHGQESTGQGVPLGAGYRRLADGWHTWSHGRTLRATYRLKRDG